MNSKTFKIRKQLRSYSTHSSLSFTPELEEAIEVKQDEDVYVVPSSDEIGKCLIIYNVKDVDKYLEKLKEQEQEE